MITKPQLAKILLEDIASEIDSTVERHKTGPSRTPWNKKSLGGRRTRGIMPEKWQAYCGRLALDEAKGDRMPDKKRAEYTAKMYARLDLSRRALEKHG
jgi:hypothetical protein